MQGRVKPIETLLAEAVEADDMEKFGKHLKAHLEASNTTLSDFADRIGLSRPTVYRMFSTNNDTRKKSIDKVLDGVGLTLSVTSKTKAG